MNINLMDINPMDKNPMGMKLYRASTEDAQEIYAMMQKIWSQMEHREWYATDTLEYITACITQRGLAVKAVDRNDRMAGFLLVYFPEQDEENMGRYLGIDGQEYGRVAYMDSIAVLPECRGMQLQKQLLSFAESLQELEDYRYLMATVSPENIHSLQNFEAMGYEKVCMTQKYGGLQRYVVCKKR